VSQLSGQCGILNFSQPYRPLRPVTGIALLFTFYNQHGATAMLDEDICKTAVEGVYSGKCSSNKGIHSGMADVLPMTKRLKQLWKWPRRESEDFRAACCTGIAMGQGCQS
jgi:hypothetical protein